MAKHCTAAAVVLALLRTHPARRQPRWRGVMRKLALALPSLKEVTVLDAKKIIQQRNCFKRSVLVPAELQVWISTCSVASRFMCLLPAFAKLKHENQDPSRFDFVRVYAAGVVTVDGP